MKPNKVKEILKSVLETNQQIQRRYFPKETPCTEEYIQALTEAVSYCDVVEGLEEKKIVYCVIATQIDWTKPKGCGFIYRNLLGCYDDIEKARELVERFINFTGGLWEDDVNYTWTRENDRVSIIKLNPFEDRQIFDCNH